MLLGAPGRTTRSKDATRGSCRSKKLLRNKDATRGGKRCSRCSRHDMRIGTLISATCFCVGQISRSTKFCLYLAFKAKLDVGGVPSNVLCITDSPQPPSSCRLFNEVPEIRCKRILQIPISVVSRGIY